MARDSNCLINSPHRHTGPVRAMDFNPFREENQLATGATESEIYIWDINTNTPTTLSRSQQSEDVQHIAWNKQSIYIKLCSKKLHDKINYTNLDLSIANMILVLSYSTFKRHSCFHIFTILYYMECERKKTIIQTDGYKFKGIIFSILTL